MGNSLEAWHKLHQEYYDYDYLTKDLATYIKVSPRTIQRWIKGKTVPDKKKLALIARYLKSKAEKISARG